LRNQEFQRYDGWNNNRANPGWGSAGSRLLRDSPPNYYDGIYKVNNSLPSPRTVSRVVFEGIHFNGKYCRFSVSDEMVMYEITASTQTGCPIEIIKIPVSVGDPAFDVNGTVKGMPFTRAKYDKSTGKGFDCPREQLNERTAWIDGSFVYSVVEAWVASMRSFENGTFKEGLEKGYPPLNEANVPLNNPPPPQAHRFLSSNRLFRYYVLSLFCVHHFQLQKDHPRWTDEELFQGARRWVIATIQKIIYYDFLPVLINEDVKPYEGYKPHVPPGVSHSFSTVASRFAYTIIPPAMILRKKAEACEFREEVGDFPAVRLCQNWWNAQDVVQEYSVDEFILGMVSQVSEDEDIVVVEDLRGYFFYGPLHFSRLDAVAATIMRGRDNGLSSYNTLRKRYNLVEKEWHTINPKLYETNKDLFDELAALYGGDIGQLDAFVGAMLEVDGEPGELLKAIMKEQFERLRDSDRFWFENRQNGFLTNEEIDLIHSITLKDIIQQTIGIPDQWLPKNVFLFQDGDPCPQPFQVNATGLEQCVPLMRFDHVTEVEGNEITFIFTLIGLGCFPLVCFGIGCVLIQRRRRMGWDCSFDNFSIATAENDPSDQFQVMIVLAFEWLHESYVRQVVVLVSPGVLTLRKPRGKCFLNFDTQVIIQHSEPNSSADHGPYCLIKLKKSHDLVLRFQSDKYLAKFLASFTNMVEKLDGHVSLISMQNEELLARAETKDRRQERLDHFFREAYARAFDQQNLRDSEVETDDVDDILNQTITRHEFAQAIGMRETDLFVQRMFAVTAKSDKEVITFAEFLEVLKKFRSVQEKYSLLFSLCDLDGDGRVQRSDLADLLRSLNVTFGVSITEDSQNDHFPGASSNADYLTKTDFEAIFLQAGKGRPLGIDMRGAKLKVDLTASLNSFAVPSTVDKSSDRWSTVGTIVAATATYRRHIFILFIFCSANLMIFLDRFRFHFYETEHLDQRRVMGAGIAITRGAAGALSFCMAIVLLTVCRNIITVLRETPFGELIPFDSAIGFHKIVAFFAAFWATVHAIGHCVNFYHVASQSKEGLHCLFQEAIVGSNFLPSISYWFYGTITGFTGILLVLVMSIIYVFALPRFMRMAYHAFRLTHLLNVAFYGLTMLHGLPRLLGSPKFWNYVIGPIIIFVIDQIMGMRQKYRKLNILNAELLPSDIIYLQFERPSSFDFCSGQWVRISSPTFSSVFNEWHAFSLASAPQSPTVELYIKAAGPWTWKLRSEILSAHADGSPYPLLHMAGPYGDGNQEWNSYEVAVMVGGGIGVTPYASTLTDLVLEITSALHHNVKCKKVYFLWICPTHKNYEWFVDVLKGVEELDQNRVIETHIFVTQLFHKFDLRTTMLCGSHCGDHQGKSMFTGLRAQNHFGRPNFDTFFSYLQSVHSESCLRIKVPEIGVFSCGPSKLNDQISSACARANRTLDSPSFMHRFETF
uniref:NAD(P)H oxidase (H2O2-forming) n=1 Tax=Haemonchus placei TaxID=6290 RepID=A0A0N4WSV0_HAEPC